MIHSSKTLNFLKYSGRLFCAMFIMACVAASVGCNAPGKRIHTESLRDKAISGVFTLILYGGNYSGDLETVAFLDREGDAYTFDIYAPAFNYKVINGLTFDEGLRKAEEFVSGHSSFHQSSLSSIVDDKSGVIGYEVRPLYLPFTYGTEDVLDIWYAAKGNKVVVTVRLKPSVDKIKTGGIEIQAP